MHPVKSHRSPRGRPLAPQVGETRSASAATALPPPDRRCRSDSRCDRSPNQSSRNLSWPPTFDDRPESSLTKWRLLDDPAQLLQKLGFERAGKSAQDRGPFRNDLLRRLPVRNGFKQVRAQGSTRSFGIVEDYTQRMAVAGTDPAYAMPEIDAIDSARALNRPDMHRKHHSIALAKRHYFGPRLHAWALLGQDEFTTREVAAGFGQQNRDLQGKNVLAVEILMQAVVVARLVLQQQRRRPGLPCGMAAFEERIMGLGIADADPHRFVPAPCHIA